MQGIARIRNVTNLALIGVGPEDSKIQCEGTAGVYFKQMIQGKLWLPCGALILNTGFDLNLTNEIVENSTG